jgi:group I intron endonuclease
MKKIIGVYKISNNLCPEGKYYIGYSSHIRSRWNNHKRHLKNGIHINMYLQKAYNKYGAECFTYEILHECETKEEAQEYETSYLQDLTIRDKLYNLLYDSIGGDTMTHHPNREEILRKNKILRQLQTSYRKDAPIVIDGVNYSGITEAGKILNIPSRTINDRIYSSSPKFINYHFLDEKKQAEALNKGLIRIENRKEKHKEFSTGRGVPILIDNIYYSSFADAAKVFNLDASTISKRVKSKNKLYSNYQYATINDDHVKTNCIRRIIIDNIYYKSLSHAGRELGTSHMNIRNRIKSPNPNFANYFYADTIQDEVKQPSLVL